RIFNPLFHISAERPITTAEAPPNEINERIKGEQKLVADVANKGEPLHVLHDSVEFVSVDDENAPSVRRAMDGMFLDRDVSVGAIKRTDHLIVVSRDVNNAGPEMDIGNPRCPEPPRART